MRVKPLIQSCVLKVPLFVSLASCVMKHEKLGFSWRNMSEYKDIYKGGKGERGTRLTIQVRKICRYGESGNVIRLWKSLNS